MRSTDGVGFNLGGGFHHAFPDHGEGFCAIHDVAVAIRRLQKDGLIERAVVVDCDVHQGNATAAIFSGDRSVLTLSIHQFNNYPTEKPPSTIDIHLADGSRRRGVPEETARRLRSADRGVPAPVGRCMSRVPIPICEDQLGGLNLTIEGLRERDRMVMEMALKHRAAVAVTLAGGYAIRISDTVTIHVNSVKVAVEAMAGWQRA